MHRSVASPNFVIVKVWAGVCRRDLKASVCVNRKWGSHLISFVTFNDRQSNNHKRYESIRRTQGLCNQTTTVQVISSHNIWRTQRCSTTDALNVWPPEIIWPKIAEKALFRVRPNKLKGRKIFTHKGIFWWRAQATQRAIMVKCIKYSMSSTNLNRKSAWYTEANVNRVRERDSGSSSKKESSSWS